jgi:hypothetical protein
MSANQATAHAPCFAGKQVSLQRRAADRTADEASREIRDERGGKDVVARTCAAMTRRYDF